jgi:hypothetical protein
MTSRAYKTTQMFPSPSAGLKGTKGEKGSKGEPRKMNNK